MVTYVVHSIAKQPALSSVVAREREREREREGEREGKAGNGLLNRIKSFRLWTERSSELFLNSKVYFRSSAEARKAKFRFNHCVVK